MSDNEEGEQPRRSARSRKSVVKFSVPTTQTRRSQQKAQAVRETEEEAMELDGSDEPESDPSSEDDFEAPRRAAKAAGGSRSKGGKSGSARGRKRKARTEDDEEADASDEEAAATGGRAGTKDYAIATDNELFEAVRHDAALELSVDDWIASYQRGKDEEAKGVPLAELINFTIRCCGCSESVDQHEVLDLDGALDKSEEIQDIFKKVTQAAYPLVAKSKQLKKFRKALSEFMSRLVEHTHTSGILYDDLFCQTFQAWLVAATSSRLRSFRHTSTVIVLEFVSALCSVAADIEEHFQKASRQKENEEKKTRSDKRRLKQFEDNANQLHEQRVQVEGYLSELLSSVFVHRYRDAEPAIRLEATRSLGQWMETYRSHFLQGGHLRYLGWVLTDSNKDVRLEAVKVLDALYSEPENIGMLQLFTERFKSRFIEMASCEPELSIRRTAISILESIDRHGLLESEQQAQVASLIFHVDAKVRRAVASYFLSRVEEVVQELIESGAKGKEDSDKEARDRLWYKCFAKLLVEQSQRLDAEANDDVTDPADTQGASQLATSAALHDIAVAGQTHGRFASAAEAVWPASEKVPIQDWESLASFVLLDHSASNDRQEQPSTSQSQSGSQELEEQQILSDAEESALVEVLAAAVAQVQSDAEAASQKLVQKDEDSDAIGDMTRSLMQLLPKLFEKHQTRSERLAELMKIVLSMRLELYLDMRMVTAYEGLWDVLVKHFLGETNTNTIESAFQTIFHLQKCGPLRDTNETKLQGCIASLCFDIRELSEGLDLASATLPSERVRLFTAAMHRLHLLFSRFDITSAINDDGDQTYANVISVVDALVDRGRNCLAAEDKIVNFAINVLFDRLLWMIRPIKMGDPDEAPEQTEIEICTAIRDELVEKLAELAIGNSTSPPESVRRSAFVCLLNTLMLLQNLGGAWTGGRVRNETLVPLRLICDDERQYRCAGFVEAELQGLLSLQQVEEAVENDSQQMTPSQTRTSKRTAPPKSTQQLTAEHSIRLVLGTFVGSVLSEVFDNRHASVLLPYYGRCDAFVDECCRKLVDKLKDDGLFNDAGTATMVSVLTNALTDALDEYINGSSSDDHALIELAKLCASATTVYKGITLIKKLPSDHFVKIQCDVIKHALDKISKLDVEDQAEKRGRAASIFKALILMLRNPSPQEAQKIQSHLKEALQALELETEGDMWEAEQAYDRRLSNAVAKLDGGKKIKKPRRASPTDESEHDDDEEEDDEPQPRKSAMKKRPKPKPRAKTSTPSRPKSSRVAAARKSIEAEQGNSDTEMRHGEDGDEAAMPEAERSPVDGESSLSASKKRKRPETAEDQDESQLAESLLSHQTVGDTLPGRKRTRAS